MEKTLAKLLQDLNNWADGCYTHHEAAMKVMDTALDLAVSIGINPDQNPTEMED
jgi:hypothetical protein